MRKFKSFLAGLLVGLVGVVGLSIGAEYYGWNPATGLETFHGTFIDGGVGTTNVPAVSGTCGTRGTEVLGATSGTIVSGAVTTCTTTLTFTTAAPTQFTCFFWDVTTPADVIGAGTGTAGSCSSPASTVVSGDKIAYLVIGQ